MELVVCMDIILKIKKEFIMKCQRCKKDVGILITLRCGTALEWNICGECFKKLKKFLKVVANKKEK